MRTQISGRENFSARPHDRKARELYKITGKITQFALSSWEMYAFQALEKPQNMKKIMNAMAKVVSNGRHKKTYHSTKPISIDPGDFIKAIESQRSMLIKAQKQIFCYIYCVEILKWLKFHSPYWTVRWKKTPVHWEFTKRMKEYALEKYRITSPNNTDVEYVIGKIGNDIKQNSLGKKRK